MVPLIIVAKERNGETLRDHLDAGASDYIYYDGAERELLGLSQNAYGQTCIVVLILLHCQCVVLGSLRGRS